MDALQSLTHVSYSAGMDVLDLKLLGQFHQEDMRDIRKVQFISWFMFVYEVELTL